MSAAQSRIFVRARPYLAAVGVFAAGVRAGFVGSLLGNAQTAGFSGSARPQASPTAPVAAVQDNPAQAAPQPATETASGAVDVIEPPAGAGRSEQSAFAMLDERLDEAQAERTRLEAELGRTRTALAALERRLQTARLEAVPADDEADTESAREREPRRVDAETLVNAGFSADDAAFISREWGEEQMALLRLRVRAEREGWLDDARYKTAARNLRRGPGSLRSALAEDEYDRFLFGTGRTNRIRVGEVIEGSPAQTVGIGANDVLLRYDDKPVYTFEDLSVAIRSDSDDEEAVLEVERDGQLLELSLPRGPIGVRVQGISVEP